MAYLVVKFRLINDSRCNLKLQIFGLMKNIYAEDFSETLFQDKVAVSIFF